MKQQLDKQLFLIKKKLVDNLSRMILKSKGIEYNAGNLAIALEGANLKSELKNEITIEDNETMEIFGIEIPNLKPVYGETFDNNHVRNKIDQEWKDHYSNSFTKWKIYMTDKKFKCFTMDYAKILYKTAVFLAFKILELKYVREGFDCDEFSEIISAITSLIMVKAGVYGVGAGIGMISISYVENGKRLYHALNVLPIYNNGDLEIYLGESQNGSIYKINYKDDVKIDRMRI